MAYLVAVDTEITTFLGGVAPFDTLDADELSAVAAAGEAVHYADGDRILVQGTEASRWAWVIRSGAVELTDEGRVIDQLGAGEMFGHRSMITGDPVSLTVAACGDTLVYRFPDDVVRPVLARPAALRHLIMSVSGRYELRAREGVSDAEPSRRAVGEIVHGEPVVCAPETLVGDAARRMTEAGSSAALVDLGEEFGIVTDSDLRTRVLGAGLGPEVRLADVMTAPVRTVDADRPGADALVDLLDSGHHHLPVVDSRHTVVGVLTDSDLISSVARSPFQLRASIMGAADVAELRKAYGLLPGAVIALHEARVPAHAISGVITSAHDALTRRVIDLTIEEMEPPPAALTWFCLGSFARREAFPDSDQDNALAWDGPVGDAEQAAWMAEFATRVVGSIEAAGIPACSKGAIASKGLFARPLADWQRVAGSWLDDPDQEKALILVSLVVDGRAVWGEDAAAAPLRATFSKAKDRPRLLRLLDSFALSHKPPLGFRGSIVVEHDGEHRGMLDIKQSGLLPIVDLARSAAMAAGVSAASTDARLRAAEAGGVIPADDVAILSDAFELMTNLRMQHQVGQLRNGDAPDCYIDPDSLTPLVRTYLKEAFQAVSRVQKNVSNSMRSP
jgi:CBS domain-containing protein